MIHERTGTATTYYGVDLEQTRPDGTRLGVLSTEPLAATVARIAPAAEPPVGWYWTGDSEGARQVWFLRREHAEAFRRHLIS